MHKMFTDRIKLQENVVPIRTAYHSAMKSHHRNYESMPLVATRNDPEGSYTKGTRGGRKKNRISHTGSNFKIYEGTHIKPQIPLQFKPKQAIPK